MSTSSTRRTQPALVLQMTVRQPGELLALWRTVGGRRNADSFRGHPAGGLILESLEWEDEVGATATATFRPGAWDACYEAAVFNACFGSEWSEAQPVTP